MKTVTESVFDGTSIVPLADVQHIEKRSNGYIAVVMKSTRYNEQAGGWDNAVYFSDAEGEASRFVEAWCRYRSELEAETLKDLRPTESEASGMPSISLFGRGLTVKELKQAIADWPETDRLGDPTVVWIENEPGVSNVVNALWPLDMRTDENGKESADIILS